MTFYGRAWELWSFIFLSAPITACLAYQHVRVFHYILPHWTDEETTGNVTCKVPERNASIFCEWIDHENQTYFKKLLKDTTDTGIVTVALFNVHSLWEKIRIRYPPNCEWPTNLTMASSEESHSRFSTLFNATFDNFDGYSTTHPLSSVQRIYDAAYLRDFTELSASTSTNTSLYKAASFIASTCHKGPHADRERVVNELRQSGVQVDGLGRCAKSAAPPGLTLHHAPHNNTLNTLYKRSVAGKYMFNLAFENAVEVGYVTEKPFDALMAGTVPVYLGDASHLKRLLPHPNAAIFVADFGGNISSLGIYLKYLMENETAFREHHAWRVGFSRDAYLAKHPILSTSWHCKVCQWAVSALALRRTRHKNGHSVTLC